MSVGTKPNSEIVPAIIAVETDSARTNIAIPFKDLRASAKFSLISLSAKSIINFFTDHKVNQSTPKPAATGTMPTNFVISAITATIPINMPIVNPIS